MTLLVCTLSVVLLDMVVVKDEYLAEEDMDTTAENGNALTPTIIIRIVGLVVSFDLLTAETITIPTIRVVNLTTLLQPPPTMVTNGNLGTQTIPVLVLTCLPMTGGEQPFLPLCLKLIVVIP